MTQAHTPGPWVVYSAPANTASGAPIETEIRGGNYIVSRLGRLTHETAHANARLIASAPELLEACIAVAGVYQDAGDDVPLFVRRCRAAIAKARGA